MKKLLALILAAVFVTALASCNGPDAQDVTEPAGDIVEENTPEDVTDIQEDVFDDDDEIIPPVVSTPAPDGFYASAESGYSAEVELLDASEATGRMTLYFNGAESASGDFRVEQTVANGQSWYYVWLAVDGAGEDIHIMTYDPNEDVLVQYEDIRVLDGEMIYGDTTREFAVFLERVISE